MEEKLLSVIVPVYNCERYIGECLDSLVDQNFFSGRYEIIVVNDCSDDNTSEIVEKYANEYNFIKIISHKQRCGVSRSRNDGIMASTGRFLTFVDADDLVAKDIYPEILNIMKSNNSNSFYFGYTRNYADLHCFKKTVKRVLKNDFCKPSSCRYIFCSSIVKNNSLFFNELMRFNEDFLFNYCYVELSNNDGLATNEALYYYRPNESSATRSLMSNPKSIQKACEDAVLFCTSMKQFIEKHNIGKTSLYKKIISCNIMNYLWLRMLQKTSPKESINYLNAKGYSLKDITFKAYEGRGIKYKFKSLLEYNFRFMIIYRITCFFYRVSHK